MRRSFELEAPRGLAAGGAREVAMRLFTRVVAIAFLACALLPPRLCARVDKPEPQVQIEAKIVEASDKFVREVGVFWRTGADGKPDLLISLPAAVGGKPVDGAEVELGQGSARDFRPSLLPPGWKLDARKDVLTLSGPALVDRKDLAIALDAAAGVKLVVAPRIQLESNGAIVLDLRPELQQLNPVQRVTDVSSVVRLPQAFSPGDTLWFTPLDPKFTPGGGTWKIGGLDAVWDGAYDRPGYSLQIPRDFPAGARPLDVSFVDLWGTRLVDGRANDLLILLRPTLAGEPADGGAPAVTGCSPGTLPGDSFCVCGDFPAGAAAQLTINGKPIGQYLVASSPTVLDFVLPADTPAGALRLDASPTSGFDIADRVRGVLIRVRGRIDRDKLKRGQSTAIDLWLDGTEEPVELRLLNRSPGIVTVEGGIDQRVTTTGGEPNQVSRVVKAVSPGDFTLTYSLEVGSCPCAGESAEEESPLEPPEDSYYDDFGPPQFEVGDDYPELVDWWTVRTWEKKLDEWLQRTKDLTVRDAATDEIADRIQREVEALDKFLDEIRPQVEQYRREARNYSKYEFLFPKSQIALYEKMQKIVTQLVFLDGRLTLLPRAGRGVSKARDACLSRLGDCDELRKVAEAAEAEARRLRAEAEQVARPWNDYERESRQLSVVRRQAAAYRELEKSALARMATSAERAKANPGKGYERDIASAQQDAAGYAADAAKLEAQAKALELAEARDSVLADFFRQQAAAAARAAAAAEERATAARRAYQECLDAAIDACPGTPAPGSAGGSTQEKPAPPAKPEPPAEPGQENPKTPETGGVVPKSGSSTPPGAEETIELERHPLPRHCGPDLTRAFEGALERVARRVAALPPSELGPEGGRKFLENNWPYYWHKTSESDAPDDDSSGHWDWDDLIWWSNEAWSDSCNDCAECRETNWLWGRCLDSDFIAHIFEDTVREMLHASFRLDLSALGEAAQGATTVPGDSCREIAQALAGAIDGKSSPAVGAGADGGQSSRAAQSAFEAAMAKFAGESGSWWGASCEKCGNYSIGEFRYDWSSESWWLSGGRVQRPDGTMVQMLQYVLDTKVISSE